MKKIIYAMMILLFIRPGTAGAAHLEELLGLRRGLLEESKALRIIIPDTKDVL